MLDNTIRIIQGNIHGKFPLLWNEIPDTALASVSGFCQVLFIYLYVFSDVGVNAKKVEASTGSETQYFQDFAFSHAPRRIADCKLPYSANTP